MGVVVAGKLNDRAGRIGSVVCGLQDVSGVLHIIDDDVQTEDEGSEYEGVLLNTLVTSS